MIALELEIFLISSLLMGVMDRTLRYFEDWARTYDLPEELPLFLKWNFKNILKHIPEKGRPVIADLGTGNGLLLINIGKMNPQCRLIGIDFSEKMLEKAEESLSRNDLEARLIKADIIKMPIGDSTVDIAVSNNTFHHIKDRLKLYSEIYRILKPKGKLVYADSHDAKDDEFEKMRGGIRKKEPEFAKAYKESADKIWHLLAKGVKEKHPPEYHYPFREVRNFLKKAGFVKIKIIPSPSYFAVVYAEKPRVIKS